MGLLPMDADILPPSDDRVFKLLMTSPEAKAGLIKLISALIGREVVDITLHPNELPAGSTEEIAERMDVNGKAKDGSQLNLEMQASHIEENPDGQHRNLKGKGVYYLTDFHSSQPAKGVRRYDLLARTYQITFCSYTIFPDRPEYVNSFSLRHDETGELLCDAIQIIFVELSKLKELLKKPVSELSDLDKWSLFLRYAPDQKYRKKVNEIIESEEVLQVAGDLLMNISKDEVERAIYRSRRKFQTDLASNIATATDNGIAIGLARGLEQGRVEGREQGRVEGREQGRVEGREEGRVEGREEGRAEGRTKQTIEIAGNMIKLGFSIDQIAAATGLSLDEIRELR